MGLKIFQVDAFTHKPFTGNPAAVCILPAPAEERWMQNIALEMNLSETAFLVREAEGFTLRWFTPLVEIDLCGHATLASAHILWEEDYLKPEEQARFYTKSGLLTADRKNDWIELNFPVEEVQETVSSSESETLVKALKIKPLYLGKSQVRYLVEVGSEEVVKNLHPDFELLKTLSGRGVVVTSRSSSKEYDFVSRYFGPKVGINEDPVTGSSHCCLTPYWSKKLNKKEMIAYQASARGGFLRVRATDDRVSLGGQAVTVLRGELAL
ncbi:MAG: PhzF family phenazine biosynthesis protein [Nitrospiria bacterium]